MTSQSTLVRANNAGLQYTLTLAAAYRRFIWLTDPDFATQNEQEAWNKVRRDASSLTPSTSGAKAWPA